MYNKKCDLLATHKEKIIIEIYFSFFLNKKKPSDKKNNATGKSLTSVDCKKINEFEKHNNNKNNKVFF